MGRFSGLGSEDWVEINKVKHVLLKFKLWKRINQCKLS